MAAKDNQDLDFTLRLKRVKKFQADAKASGRALRGLGSDARKSGKDGGSFSDTVEKLQKNLFGLIAPAAKITAVGLGASAMSAAAAGAVSLGVGLAPLAGAGAAAAGGVLAYQQALQTAKFAMGGVESSFKGVFDSFNQATPMTNRLASEVKKFVPDLLHLRNLAQGRMLSGLIDGLQRVGPMIKSFNPLARQMGSTLGDLARFGAGMTVAMGPQLSRVLSSNVGLIRMGGQSAIRLAAAFLYVLDAARPLTAWLGRTIDGWARFIAVQAKVGNESGKLNGFFERTRQVLSHVFSIGKSLGVTLFNIGKGGSALGRELVGSLDKAAAAMARWSSSTKGQASIGKFFAQAKAPIYEVAKLIRDVVKAFFSLSGQGNGQLAPLIAQIRTQLLPILVSVVSSTTSAFGPHLINLITQLAKAFEPLAGSPGPLVVLVDMMAKTAEVSALIAQKVPGGSAAITTLFGALAVFKAASLFSLITGLGKFVRLIMTLTPAARAAAAAEGTLTFAQKALNFAIGMNPILRTVTIIIALAGALTLAYKKVGWFHKAVDAVWNFIKSHWVLIGTMILGPILPAIVLVVRNFGKIRGAVSSAFGFVKRAVSGIGGAISKPFDRAIHFVADRFRDLGGLIGRIFGAIKSFIQPVADAVGKTVGALGNIGSLPGGILKKIGLHEGGFVPGYASGGQIHGHGRGDRQPIVAEAGEFVVKRSAAKRVGPAALQSMNRGVIPAAADAAGEMVIHVYSILDGKQIGHSVARQTANTRSRR